MMLDSGILFCYIFQTLPGHSCHCWVNPLGGQSFKDNMKEERAVVSTIGGKIGGIDLGIILSVG